MRVALVGAGNWGKNHARVLSELGVLCAVCDANPHKARELAGAYHVAHHGSVPDLLASEDFDAAVVATPNTTHFDAASELLNSKKHTLVEKPLTHSSNQADRLVELAKKNKVVLTCGYVERFNPAVALVRPRIIAKEWGDLLMLEFHRENSMPANSNDVGAIYDTAVHDIDAANWLFGSTPTVVFARTGIMPSGKEDFASIMLGYGRDRTAVITANRIMPKRIRTLNAICTSAIIRSDYISQSARIDGKGAAEELADDQAKEPLLQELQAFLDAAQGVGDPAVLPQDAANTTAIAEAALLSSQKGVPIYLELK